MVNIFAYECRQQQQQQQQQHQQQQIQQQSSFRNNPEVKQHKGRLDSAQVS